MVSERRVHRSRQPTKAPLTELSLPGNSESRSPLLGVLNEGTLTTPRDGTFTFMFFPNQMHLSPLNEPAHSLCHRRVGPNANQILTISWVVRGRWRLILRFIRRDHTAHRRDGRLNFKGLFLLVNHQRQRWFLSRWIHSLRNGSMVIHKLMPSPGVSWEEPIRGQRNRWELLHQQLDEAGNTPQLHRSRPMLSASWVQNSHRHGSPRLLLAITATSFRNLDPISNGLHVWWRKSKCVRHRGEATTKAVERGTLGLCRIHTTLHQGATKKFEVAPTRHLSRAPKSCRLCDLPEVIRMKLQGWNQILGVNHSLMLPKTTEDLEQAAATKHHLWQRPGVGWPAAPLPSLSLGTSHLGPGRVILHVLRPLNVLPSHTSNRCHNYQSQDDLMSPLGLLQNQQEICKLPRLEFRGLTSWVGSCMELKWLNKPMGDRYVSTQARHKPGQSCMHRCWRCRSSCCNLLQEGCQKQRWRVAVVCIVLKAKPKPSLVGGHQHPQPVNRQSHGRRHRSIAKFSPPKGISKVGRSHPHLFQIQDVVHCQLKQSINFELTGGILLSKRIFCPLFGQNHRPWDTTTTNHQWSNPVRRRSRLHRWCLRRFRSTSTQTRIAKLNHRCHYPMSLVLHFASG